MSEKFLEDKVEEYMSFYDDLLYINQTLTTQKKKRKLYVKKIYTDATAEKRRISAEMRSILLSWD